MNIKRTFLYQPNFLTMLICWSWTLTILLLGLVFWLEVTYFQWITLFFFILAGFLMIIEIFFRKIVVNQNKITIQKVMNPNWMHLEPRSVQSQIMSKHHLRIDTGEHQYDFILSVNSVIELNAIINSYHK